jgi:hypothetical protein
LRNRYWRSKKSKKGLKGELGDLHHEIAAMKAVDDELEDVTKARRRGPHRHSAWLFPLPIEIIHMKEGGLRPVDSAALV